MLDHETNAYLCDVERGKPMHALLKRYWLPAALSSDVAEPNSGVSPARSAARMATGKIAQVCEPVKRSAACPTW